MARRDASFLRFYQQLLRNIGYDVPITGTDQPGDATHKAAADFQAMVGLPVTGLATDETIAALRSYKPPGLSGTVSAGQATGPSITLPMKLAPPAPIANGPQHRPTPSRPYWTRKSPQAPIGTPMPSAPGPVSEGERGAVSDFWQRFGTGNAGMDDYPTSYGRPEQQDIGGGNSPLAGVDFYRPDMPTPEMRPATPLDNISKVPTRHQFSDAFASSPAATSGPWAPYPMRAGVLPSAPAFKPSPTEERPALQDALNRNIAQKKVQDELLRQILMLRLTPTDQPPITITPLP